MVGAWVTVGSGAYDTDLHAVRDIARAVTACDLWLRTSLGGATPADSIGLARLRGLALGSAALTLAMSGWKAIGPLTVSDLLLIGSVLLLLPSFDLARAQNLWFPALAVVLIAVGGVVGTAATSGADVTGSAELLVRFAVASLGAMLLVACWRPRLEQIRSFSWLWIAGGVISAMVALLTPENDPFRPPGLAPHPNHLAIISLILLGVTLGLIASDRRRPQIVVGLTAASVLFAAIVASGSRAGLAAALIVVALALIATRDRTTVTVTVGVASVCVALLLLGAVGDQNAFERLSERGVERGQKREALNEAAWESFKSDPITGVGFADALEPHNYFLLMGSAGGLLAIIGGAMLVVLALRSYVVAVWRRIAEHPAHWAMAAGLSAAVIGYLAASTFQNVLWDRSVWIAISLMTWMVSVGAAVTIAVDDREGGEDGA